MERQYPFSAYDKTYLSLKLSIPMWGAIIFLSRPFVVLLLSISNRRDKTGLMTSVYHDPVSLAIDTFAALPALLVVIAWFRRKPEASPIIHWIWTNGRLLLLLATLLNIASIFLPLIWNPQLRMAVPEFAKLAVSLMILFMLIRSERVRDTFNDFPQPIEEKNKPAQ